ncbi:MAG: class II glutamine amidotransferase [Candidatus Bathyarchaeia archaeon]
MLRRAVSSALLILLIISILSLGVVPGTRLNEVSASHECRLWGITSTSLSSYVVLNQLIYLPNSLKALGASNPNGWGLGFYNNTEPTVLRGQSAANTDPNFDLAASEVAGSGAIIAVGHVRRASSGLVNIPDPHPFERYKDGKWWLFCHNGGIDKTILINLIGTEYLAQNPPSVGSNQGEWIDSELYFIYILKCCEQSNWNVQEGITKAIVGICNAVSGTGETLNFLLTDGQTLWGFSKGNTLYYYRDPQYLAIASQYPTASHGAWMTVSDFYLVTLFRGNAPSVQRLCYSVTALVKDSSTGRSVSQANVTLDGAYIGMTDSSGKLFLQAVAPGSHTLTVTKTGYYNAAASINVTSDVTATVRLKRK